jgi:outer membrane protein assembly factor BamB
MRYVRFVLLVAALPLLAACSKSGAPACSLNGGTQLAPTPAPTMSETPSSTWPKFRADQANTGRTAIDLTQNSGVGTLLFNGFCGANGVQVVPTQTCIFENPQCTGNPSATCTRIGPVSTTPIIGLQPSDEPPCGERGTFGPQGIYVASSDGTVYVYCVGGEPTHISDLMQLNGPVTGSPLLGANSVLFVPGTGAVVQFFNDGERKNTGSVSGFVAASPNIWQGNGKTPDGTVYVGTLAGLFAAVCPNGAQRFPALTFPSTQSTAAIIPFPTPNPNPQPDQVNPIVIAGGVNGQVRAFNVRGRQYWSYLASANIAAAILIDQTTNLFYVADTGGQVSAASLITGRPDPGFAFAPGPDEQPASFTASPALGRDDAPLPKLYVAAQSLVGQSPAEQRGVLMALDRATGKVCWTFTADGPISSSPAVGTGGDHDVIVFAADTVEVLNPAIGPVATGGRVYAIPDRDDDRCDDTPRCAGEDNCPLWIFDAASLPPGHSYSFGASSPSVGPDGTVYIGRTGSRLGSGSECPTAEPCVVNDGGALYAIGP